MKQEVLGLLESHRNWIGDNTSFSILDDSVEINLPFLNHHNDYIQVYLIKNGENYVISDEGETVDDLKSCGLEFKTHKRQELLRSAIVGFGVTNDNHILKTEATSDNFGIRLNRLIQAILAVNELLILAQPVFPSDFQPSVENWLKKNNIEFQGNREIIGKSGLKHSFDFTIISDTDRRSQMIKLVNKPSMDIARKLAFTSIDIGKEESLNSKVAAIINDPKNSNLRLFGQVLYHYDVETVHWSKRNESFNKFKTLHSTFRENDQLRMEF